MSDVQELLTLQDAVQACRCDAQTLLEWLGEGKLPVEKHGNYLMVRRADLERLTAERREQEKAKRLAALERIIANADQIYQRVGSINILEELDRSRESHP